jgi:hypothetical protein
MNIKQGIINTRWRPCRLDPDEVVHLYLLTVSTLWTPKEIPSNLNSLDTFIKETGSNKVKTFKSWIHPMWYGVAEHNNKRDYKKIEAEVSYGSLPFFTSLHLTDFFSPWDQTQQNKYHSSLTEGMVSKWWTGVLCCGCHPPSLCLSLSLSLCVSLSPYSSIWCPHPTVAALVCQLPTVGSQTASEMGRH